jgi:Zn-dependent M16 (insulinase) family peptidase
MHQASKLAVLGLFLASMGLNRANASTWLERFNERPTLEGFTCRHLYLDSQDQVAGACLVHESGFTLDLLPMDTAPQAFVWIHTPVADDRGEPHTLEHLLLGKGRRGLAVANAEEFRLSSSSAFTGQLETCYHFSTALSSADFLVELEDRLDALLHPDFSDEEIRREVCHIGPKAGPQGLELEEKGTVYTEMLSSWDHPWSRAGRKLQEWLHGNGHPLAVNQGGIPEAIRRMEPADIRAFHQRSHFLGNMGAQVVLPAGDMTESLLARLNQSLRRLEKAVPGLAPSPRSTLPPSRPAPEARCEVLDVPGAREGEAALVLAAWPPVKDLDRQEQLEAQFFLSVAAQGESSDLHGQLLDPQVTTDPVGAAYVSCWLAEEPGHPVNLSLGSVPAARVTEEGLKALRDRICRRFGEVAAWPAGHAELEALKTRELALISAARRQGRTMLDHPPGFGERGTGSYWADHLRTLRESGGFRLRLDQEPLLARLEARLKTPGNPYSALLSRLGLANQLPHVVGTRSQPALLEEKESQRVARLEAFADSLESAYGTQDRQQALRRFAADYEATSAQLEAQRVGLTVPELPRELPFDLDPELPVEMAVLDSGTPLCHGRFDAMQGAQWNMAVDVGEGPSSPWMPLLPAFLTETGLQGDDTLDFRQVEDALRREVGWASCWLDTDLEAGRAELVLGASGASAAECARGLHWLRRFCLDANWSAANRPRLREIARRELAQARERRQGSEESWVEVPAAAWPQRQQPGLLRAGCFLTQEHELFRCAWALEPRPEGFNALLAQLETRGRKPDSTRAWLRTLLDTPVPRRSASWSKAFHRTAALSAPQVSALGLALEDLDAFAAELPEVEFPMLWDRLVMEILSAPLLLDELEKLRPALLQGSRRAWFTGSLAARHAVMEEAQRLDAAFARKSVLRSAPITLWQVPLSPNALCGLVDPGGSSGVILSTAPLAWQQAFTRPDLEDYLAGNLLGGGSDQGLFMQTWAAGLAYSNGIRPRERTGQLRYYAERCPDAAQTLTFVEDKVRQAPAVDVARSQTAFITAMGGSRGALDHPERTAHRARELQQVLVDTPTGRRTQRWQQGPTGLDELRTFRGALVDLMKDEELPARLEERKLPVHALVFPGLGAPDWRPVLGGQFFVIGPERQFDLVDAYLATRSQGLKVQRLRPCHWWYLEARP